MGHSSYFGDFDWIMRKFWKHNRKASVGNKKEFQAFCIQSNKRTVQIKSSTKNDSWQTMSKLADYSMELIRETRSEKQMSSFDYGEELKPYTKMNPKTKQTTTRATWSWRRVLSYLKCCIKGWYLRFTTFLLSSKNCLIIRIMIYLFIMLIFLSCLKNKIHMWEKSHHRINRR